jgi:hypothetical protein
LILHVFKEKLTFCQSALLKKSYAYENDYVTTSWTAMNNRLETVTEMIDIETFIQRAHQILDKIKPNPTSPAKAREEAVNLIIQFEEYLKFKGLEC